MVLAGRGRAPGPGDLDRAAPGLPVDDRALGRLLVPRDRRARLPGAAAGRPDHRGGVAERVGLLPRLPAAVPAADDGDRSGLPGGRLDPGPGLRGRRGGAHGGAAARPGRPARRVRRGAGLRHLRRVAHPAGGLHRVPGDAAAGRVPPRARAGAVAGRLGARAGHRGHPADRGAPGPGRPGGGRRCAGATAPASGCRAASCSRWVTVLAACGVAGLAWPAIAWWRTGVRSAYTDTMATWRVDRRGDAVAAVAGHRPLRRRRHAGPDRAGGAGGGARADGARAVGPRARAAAAHVVPGLPGLPRRRPRPVDQHLPLPPAAVPARRRAGRRRLGPAPPQGLRWRTGVLVVAGLLLQVWWVWELYRFVPPSDFPP